MTRTQLLFALGGYTAVLFVVAFVTRANRRRVFGAVLGGAAAGVFFLIAFRLGLHLGVWRASLPSTPGLWLLLYATVAISLAPIYPVMWRVERRYGSRGLAVTLVLAALVGPPRDYLVARFYPDWLTFSSGTAPLLAVAFTYFGVVGIGHTVMRLFSGPAGRDPLVRPRHGAA